MLMNLIPGQYQIANRVVGRGTTVPMESFDIQPYDIEAQDFARARSDEINFAIDSFKPTTITMNFHVLNNWLLDENAGIDPLTFWKEMPTKAEFARFWRADEVRNQPGQIMPIYACGKDGITRVIFGRTRQFTYTKSDKYTLADSCLGEFQRADALAYTAQEQAVSIAQSAAPVFIRRDGGDLPTWYRIIINGPVTNPVITVGEQQISLATSVPAGKVIEISSYPWARRVINSDRINLSANLNGKNIYLDKLMIPVGEDVPVRWTSDEVNTWVPALGNANWNETIQDHNIWDLPTEFTTLAGTASVRTDIFNFGSASFPWITPSKYLAAIEFGTTTAILYHAKKYNTKKQYCQAQIVEPWGGRSAIVIMSTENMNSFVCLEVQSGLFANWLRIRSGTGWNLADTTVRAQWQNTDLFGWRETDIPSIEYDEDNKRYIAKLNGVEKCHWDDTEEIVPTGTANRSQGFIFNMDGFLFITKGTGFKNIVAYDKAVVPAETGQVFLLWRDAWSTIE